MLEVLDHGFVRLVDSLGDDLRVVNCARVSFGKEKNKTDKSDEKLIRYLAFNNHTSPFRHVQFTFHCKVPEFIARQWYKHVVGISYTEGSNCKDHGWNEISGRYVDAEVFDFYTPSSLRKDDPNNKQSSVLAAISDQAYKMFEQSNVAAMLKYKALRDLGVCKEQARCVLPLSFYTEFYWTVSLQALAHFIKLRSDSHAQYEIQLYANALYDLAKHVAPISLDSLLQQIDSTN